MNFFYKISNGFLFLFIAVLVVLYFQVLTFGYENFVYAWFSYNGFKFDLDWVRRFFGIVVVILILATIYWKKKSSLMPLYFVLYVLIVIPSAVYYANSGEGLGIYVVGLIVFWLLVLFLPVNQLRKNAGRDLLNNRSMRRLIFVGWFFLVTCLFYLIYSTGGSFVVGFEDVYDFRAENLNSGIAGYFVNWTTKVIAPLVYMYYLLKRRWSIVFFVIFLIFCLYSLTGHKSVLMPIGLCFLLYWLVDGAKKNPFVSIAKSNLIFCFSFLFFVALFAIAVYFVYVLFDNILIPSIFFRRTFFVPPFLNSIYWELFSHSPHVYWSNGILSPFISYPYGQSVTREVGIYLGREGVAANTGFIASGYMQAGYWGVFAYFSIVFLLNKMLSWISSSIDLAFFYAVLFMPFLTMFSSSDLPSSFLTHGMIISVAFLMFGSGKLKVK